MISSLPAALPFLLRARGIHKSFGSRPVLQDVNLETRPGEVILLRGENGSGKSTLIDILTGLLEPDAGKFEYALSPGQLHQISRGSGWRPRLDLGSRAVRFAKIGVGRCWQDVRLFDSLSLVENVAVAFPDQVGENPLGALRRKVVQRQEELLTRRAVDMLRRAGLEDRADLAPSELSTGHAKKVAIARSIAAGARMLFLDEPLAGLDVSAAEDTIEMLRDLRNSGITLVVVEHIFNIPRLLDLATSVWTLKEGRIAEGSTQSVREEIRKTGFGGLEGWIGKLLAGLPINSKTILGGDAVLTIANLGVPNEVASLLEVADLVLYRGRRRVIGWEMQTPSEIAGLTFTLRENQLAVLEAPNGWGKSTLLEAIAGLVPVHSGTLTYDGHDLSQRPVWERRQAKIALLGTGQSGFQRLSVGEVANLARVQALPQRILPLQNRQVGTLSGGEYRSLQISTVLVGENRLRLLDEPFDMLDQDAVESMIALLRHSSHGATLMAVPMQL
jgi:branched-chain amino acid transport system ATP-binding protein